MQNAYRHVTVGECHFMQILLSAGHEENDDDTLIVSHAGFALFRLLRLPMLISLDASKSFSTGLSGVRVQHTFQLNEREGSCAAQESCRLPSPTSHDASRISSPCLGSGCWPHRGTERRCATPSGRRHESLGTRLSADFTAQPSAERQRGRCAGRRPAPSKRGHAPATSDALPKAAPPRPRHPPPGPGPRRRSPAGMAEALDLTRTAARRGC